MRSSPTFIASVVCPVALCLHGLLPAVAPASASEKEPATPLPGIETFMQIGAAGRPILSPDGSRLFFMSNLSGVNQVYRLLPQGWPYQLTFVPEGVDFAAFSDDCDLAVIGTDAGGNEQYQFSLLDTRSGTIRELTSDPGVRHNSPVWSPDGRRIYYSANEPDPASFSVYEMDLASGRTRLLLDLKGASSAADVSPDGGRLVVRNATSSQDDDVYVLDLADLSKELITPHAGEHGFSGGVFSADGRSVYLVTDDTPDGINRLARIDLQTRKREFLDAGSRWEIETFGLSQDRRFLAYVSNEDGYGRLHLRDLEAATALPAPETDGIVSSPSCSNTGYVAYAFNSPTRPPDVWVWSFGAAAGQLRDRAPARTEVEPGGAPDSLLPQEPPWLAGPVRNPLQVTFSSYAGIDPGIFHEPTLVRYRSFDGMEIPAFLYLPPGFDGHPVPFLIEAHGGPAQQYRPFFNRHFQFLMQHGFGILAPNFRGSSGYGRDFEDADNYRKRLDAVRDVAAGAQWLIDRGYARRGRIGIKGASYGGYMTLAAMTEFPDLFAAGVDQVGIADFQTFLQGTADYRRELRESEYGPLSDVEFLRSISPIHKTDRIRGALLVVHGRNDPRVPVEEARRILRAVQAHGTPVDSLIFPDEGHGIARRDNQLILYRKMVEFFEKYLGMAAAPSPAGPHRRD